MSSPSNRSPVPAVEVFVDALVLDGVHGLDPHAFGPALQRELARLLTSEGLAARAARDREGDEQQIPHVSLEAGLGAIESQVARVVWRALDPRAATRGEGEQP